MLLKLEAGQLRPGMFVILPSKWMNHPFLSNKFVIKSQDQIEKILNSGFAEVMIDTRKGISPADPAETSGHAVENAPKRRPIETVVDALAESPIKGNMSSEQKAEVVYAYSTEIMGNLLEDPKPENIIQAKKGFCHIVDAVYSEYLSSNLIRLIQHDFNTDTHSANVGVLSVLLAQSVLGESAEHDSHELGAGFFLHDLGKACIPSEIINKIGPLTAREMEIMKTHPEKGRELLSSAGQLSDEVRDIVMQHHERENGTGYPLGLFRDEIFICAKICRVADVFDVLTTRRAYHKKRTAYEALSIMKNEMSFDKDVFQKFVLLFTDKQHT